MDLDPMDLIAAAGAPRRARQHYVIPRGRARIPAGGGGVMIGPRQAMLAALLAVLAAAAPCRAAAPSARPVVLHPAVGDTLDAEELRRWNLFPDLPAARRAVVVRTAAGGLLARIELPGRGGAVIRERSVTADQWRAWREALEAGVPVAAAPPPPRGRVWPETELDPAEIAPPPPPPDPADFRTRLTGDWVMHLDLGYKHSTTVFNEFFTDMAMVQMDVGYAVSDHVTPYFGFQTGFGDLVDEFEELVGNGKSAVYAFELGLHADLPLGDRTSLTAALAGGYYMRSMRWGGDYFTTVYGTLQSGGALVRELSDWGGSVRLGLRRRLGVGPGAPVFLQGGVRWEAYGADASLLYDPVSDIEIRADDHDRWLAVTVGLLFEL